LAGIALVGLAMGQAVMLLRAHLAFESRTPESVQMTAAIGDSDSLERWAELARDRDDGGKDEENQADEKQTAENHADKALRLAVRANPRAASAWIGLGFAAERASNGRAARDHFERAFQVDRQYLPAWTLANFCFRRRDSACFWRAARRAANVAPPDIAESDLRPLLTLAVRMAPAPATAVDELGGSARLERACLDFLIDERRLADALGVARRMVSHRQEGDAARLDDFVNRLIEAGSFDAGIEIWNGMARFEALDPRSGIVLTNGDLRSAPLNSGFDWRVASGPGNRFEWEPGQLALHLPVGEARGGTGDRRELLRQVLPLSSGRYRLRFEYSVLEGAAWEPKAPVFQEPKAPVFQWTLGEVAGPLLTPDAEWRESQWTFRAAQRGFQVLRLVYRREPGVVSGGKSVRLRRFRLEVA